MSSKGLLEDDTRLKDKAMTEFDEMEKSNMMRGMARIDAVEGGFVYATPIPQAACGGCAAAKGCGVSALSGYFGNRSQPLVLADDFNGRPGETIEIGLPQSTLNKAAFTSYGPPVAGLLIGGGLAGAGGASDGVAALSAGVGLVVGLALSRFLSRRLAGLTPVFIGKTVVPGGVCLEG